MLQTPSIVSASGGPSQLSSARVAKLTTGFSTAGSRIGLVGLSAFSTVEDGVRRAQILTPSSPHAGHEDVLVAHAVLDMARKRDVTTESVGSDKSAGSGGRVWASDGAELFSDPQGMRARVSSSGSEGSRSSGSRRSAPKGERVVSVYPLSPGPKPSIFELKALHIFLTEDDEYHYAPKIKAAVAELSGKLTTMNPDFKVELHHFIGISGALEYVETCEILPHLSIFDNNILGSGDGVRTVSAALIEKAACIGGHPLIAAHSSDYNGVYGDKPIIHSLGIEARVEKGDTKTFDADTLMKVLRCRYEIPAAIEGK